MYIDEHEETTLRQKKWRRGIQLNVQWKWNASSLNQNSTEARTPVHEDQAVGSCGSTVLRRLWIRFRRQCRDAAEQYAEEHLLGEILILGRTEEEHQITVIGAAPDYDAVMNPAACYIQDADYGRRWDPYASRRPSQVHHCTRDLQIGPPAEDFGIPSCIQALLGVCSFASSIDAQDMQG